MISCEKDGPYIGFSHCPVCSAKYATEMGKTIRALETALAAMTAERDSLKDAVHFLNTMNDEQDEWFTRIADDHGGWHEDLPTGEAHIEEIIGNLKKERDARDVAMKKLGRVAAWMKLNMADPRIASACLRRHVDGMEKLVPLVEALNTDWIDAMNNPLARAAVEGER